jgi:hypothetical protein
MSERQALFISPATPEGNDFTIWLGAKLEDVRLPCHCVRRSSSDDLRHTHASELLWRGTPLKTVSDLHGPQNGVRTSEVLAELSALKFGGKGEIRTHGQLSPSAVFKTAALNRSATFPLSKSSR